MANMIVVGISDLKIAYGSDLLITYALGSCVGTCMYDSLLHIAGLSHVLLPDSSLCNDSNTMKYADTALPELLRAMERAGASRTRITAKIAGGANMFTTTNMGIGERNVIAVKSVLAALRIRILAEDTGSNYGRTVEFHSDDGAMVVKSMLHGNKTL